jgi:hypothetical protein
VSFRTPFDYRERPQFAEPVVLGRQVDEIADCELDRLNAEVLAGGNFTQALV